MDKILLFENLTQREKELYKGNMRLERSINCYLKFIDSLKKNNDTLVSDFKNNRTKVVVKFGCGHGEKYVRPDHYLCGVGCKECAKDRLINAVKQKSIRAGKILGELTIKNGHKLLSEYVNDETKVLIDFNCGHKPQWITPYKYKEYPYCRCCNKGRSKREQEIYEYISKNSNDMVIRTFREFNDLRSKKGNNLEFDIVICTSGKTVDYNNVFIEVQGEAHRYPVRFGSMSIEEAEYRYKRTIYHDKLKREYCKKNNMKLIEIWYDDDYKQVLHDNGIVLLNKEAV